MFSLVKKYKLIFLISIEFLLIYLIYLLKTVPGCSGYEPSIYAMYPDTFWLIYFIIYLFSLSIIIYSIFIKYDYLSFYSSLTNLLILNFILLLLPFFRSYFSMDFGDSTIHLAYVRDILSAHNIGEHGTVQMDAYPITHTLSAILILFTKIKLETIGQIIGPYYYLLYVLFLFLFSRLLYKNNEKSMLVLLFILVPFFRYYQYYQSLLFFCFLSVLLYVFIKDITSNNKSNSFRYILVILIVILPIMHPASSVFLIIFSTIVIMAYYITDPENFTFKSYKNTPLLFLVIWLFWTTSLKIHFSSWIHHYRNLISGLPEQAMAYARYTAALEEAQLSVINTITLYIKLFGPIQILLAISLVFSIYTIYNWIKKRDTNINLNRTFLLIFLPSLALYISTFFRAFTLLGFRLHPYVLLTSILLNANCIVNLINSSKTKRRKHISLIFIIILLFSMTYIATIALYDSPYIKRSPSHGTFMYIDGTKWLLQTRNNELPIEELEYYQSHSAKYLWGRRKTLPNLKDLVSPRIIPDHFNYTTENLLSKSFKKDWYLLINKKSELISVNIFPEYEYRWLFTPDDYKKLDYDRSIYKIYHNNEIRIFYVNGRRYK